MPVREAILPEEVLIVCDEEEASGAPMNLGIRLITTKSALALSLANLPEASEIGEQLRHVCPNVVVEQNEWRLLRFSILARH